jgi:uncharacterized protein YggE
MKRQIEIIIGAILCVALATGYLALTSGHAQTLSQSTTAQQTDSTTRTVQVTGMGEVQAVPDTAVIQLGVQTEGKTAQAALSQNSTEMQAIMAALEKAKVPSNNIQTQTVSLSPRYETNNTTNSRTLVGFTASNIVEVRTTNLSSLGTLLDQAVTAGANTIENISFEVTNSGKLTDQARQAAVEDARHKAEQLAQLTGATLGPVLKIQETSSSPTPIVQQFAAPAAAAVPISPGSQNISVEVQVTWTLMPSSQ